MEDISLEKIRWLLERAIAAVGQSNLQLSGGEPTLRDDLPEIVEIARTVGYSFLYKSRQTVSALLLTKTTCNVFQRQVSRRHFSNLTGLMMKFISR